MSADLEQIIAKGNRSLHPPYRAGENKIVCADGFTLSVIAGEGAYCSPRPTRFLNSGMGDVAQEYPGPYHEVEVGFPSSRPEPWGEWEEYAESKDDPVESVYGYVPVDLVRALVASHGGAR